MRVLGLIGWILLSACTSAGEPVRAPAAPTEAPPPPPAPETASSRAMQAEPQPERALTRLPPDLRRELEAVRPDPPPRSTTRNRHYFTSNENQHHLWRSAVDGIGGVQIGVGTDQNYLLAGWARPEILILLDYDQWVVDLNRVYGLLFEQSADPESFVDAWAYRSRSRVRGWIEERWPERKDQLRMLRAFEAARGEVHGRLERLRRRHEKLGIASFLDDTEQYAWVAGLWRFGRVLTVRGNLVEKTTLADVARFSRRAELPVRILYLSNAEDYFDYATGNYRDNVLGLPVDERSLVLHTKPRDGDFYRYLVTPAATYRAWLESGRAGSFCELFAYAEPAGGSDPDLYRLEAAPDSAEPKTARCSRE